MSQSILFVFYPWSVKYNHGIALLSSLCKQEGIEVDLCVLDSTDRFNAALKGSEWTHIGFSAVTVHDFDKMLPFIRMVHGGPAKVIVGGTYAPDIPKFFDDEFLVCRGECERLPEYILNNNSSVLTHPELCKDLNALPLPDYELFKDIPFNRGMGILDGKKILPYYSSRGCPYECSFCLIQKQKHGLRIRTKVDEDLREITERYKPDMIFIGDALTPYYSKAWRDSWSDFRFPFFAYIRADIKPEELEWMIDRGMIACSFGVESGDERYRNDVLRKHLTDKELFRTVGTLKKHGIQFLPFFMRGTPGETMAMKAKTFEMSKALSTYSIIWDYEVL